MVSDSPDVNGGAMPVRNDRQITAEDLYRLQTISSCEISPDGRYVIFSVHRVDKKTEKKYSNVWVVPTDGGGARQFTRGEQMDVQPQWSPGGAQIAFLSNRVDEGQQQLYVVPFDGGEARRLSDLTGTFGTFEWSPDGRQLVFSFRKKDRADIEREADEQKKKLGVVSRRIERVNFKYDGAGFLPRGRWHIWTINTRTGRAKQLTDGEVHDEQEPRWSPDGRLIAFFSNRSDDPDSDREGVDLFVMPANGGEPSKIETPLGLKKLASFSPDGEWLAYVGTEGRGDWWKNDRLWVVPADGKGEARNLTIESDFTVSTETLADVGSLEMTPPTWSPDGETIYFQVSHHGNTVVKSISRDGGSLASVVEEDGVVGAFTLGGAQSKLAYIHGDIADPGQIWVRQVPGQRPRRLTRLNRTVLRKTEDFEVEEVWIKGPAGNDLEGWIVKPPGFDASRKYPSILEIHGGPLAQYGRFFMHEFYYLASQGYVVYFSNPRGGKGYGEEHAGAAWNNWGTVDYDDVMAWTDFVEQKPYIDKDRMGVTGGSYGGYMTNWIIGHTDRFKAAVTQRSVSDLVSFYGATDMNWVWQQVFGDEPPWEDTENYWRQSPMKYIGNVKTPTMVIHSEQDLRCPIEQSEQVFVALKRLGVDTEMIRFPGESHGLSRGGRTDRRVERLHHILRWFDRYLK
jgi:dipeptidyl aminopeptidase/acylaminoacyl peptidase